MPGRSRDAASARPCSGTPTIRGRVKARMRAAFLLSLCLMTAMLMGLQPAAAYWQSAGTGSGSVTTGSLAAPTSVTVPPVADSSVPVSWTTSTGTPAGIGYYVTRSTGSITAPACGSSPAAPVAGTSCIDTGVRDGAYTYTVTAVYRSWTAPGAPSGTVTVATPAKTAFTVSPSTTPAGTSLVPAIKVSVQAINGTPVPRAGIPVTIALGINPGNGTLSGTLTAPTDASGTATFAALSVDKAETGYTLTATSPGLAASTSSPFTVTAASADRIVFTTPVLSGAASAGASLGPATVQLRDAFGNPVTAPAGGTVLSLTSSSATGRFSATSQGAAATTVTVPAGSSTATFYYGDTTAGTPALTVGRTGHTAATQNATINPGTADRIVFTTPVLSGAASADASLGPATVQLRDAFGNPVAAPAGGTVLSLTSSSATGRFSATSQGAAATTVTVPAGSSTVSFYYGDTTAGTRTLTVGRTGLAAATQTATITAAPANLVFTTPVLSGAASAGASLGPATVQLRDAFGNPVAAPAGGTVLTLTSSSATGRFSSTAQGTATTTVTVPAGSSTVSFYYGDTSAGTPTLSVGRTGLAAATQTATITPAAAVALRITQQPATVGNNAVVTPAIIIRTIDAFGNFTAVTSPLTITLTTDKGSTKGHEAGVTIPAGGSTATFDNLTLNGVGQRTLTFTAPGLTPVNAPITVN